MIIPFAITCLKLAAKYDGAYWIKIKRLAELFDWEGVVEELEVKCSLLQAENLESINYDVSFETSYSVFQAAVDENPVLDLEGKRLVMKFLFSALYYSMQLSQNPEYGTRIFEWVALKRRDEQIRSYIKKVVVWESQETAKRKQQDISLRIPEHQA